MGEENKPLDQVEAADAAPETAPDGVQPPKRPTYTTGQRVLALLGAIVVAIITLMYTYSIATGDLFLR